MSVSTGCAARSIPNVFMILSVSHCASVVLATTVAEPVGPSRDISVNQQMAWLRGGALASIARHRAIEFAAECSSASDAARYPERG